MESSAFHVRLARWLGELSIIALMSSLLRARAHVHCPNYVAPF